MNTITRKMLRDLELKGKNIKTPSYIVSKEIIENNIDMLYESFNRVFRNFIFAYSYKTNYAPCVIKTIHEKGGYAEVVSPVELEHALKFVGNDKIIYNGVIPDSHGKYNLAKSGGIVNVENMTELYEINHIAEKDCHIVNLGIRVNLSVDGVEQSRFGIRITPDTEREIKSLDNINIVGVHCHVTKSRDLMSWFLKAQSMAQIAKKFNARYIDLGGNMYGPMNSELLKQFKEEIPSFAYYARCIHDAFSKFYREQNMPCLIIEPGTPIISNAQSYVTTATNIKNIDNSTIVTVDGKKLDISVLGDSGKQFPFYVIGNSNNQLTDAKVFGCTCLEYDKFVNSYTGTLDIGDRILIDNIGSYSNVLSPQFIQGVPAMYEYYDSNFTLAKRSSCYETVFKDYIF